MGKRTLEMPTEVQSLQELWLMYYNITVNILRNYKNPTLSDNEFRECVGQIFKDNKLID